MDPRANFQRFFDDMDAISRRKQQEISELNEQLVTLREQVSEEEAKKLMLQQETTNAPSSNEDNPAQHDFEKLLQEQHDHYEQQIANLNYELTELESANHGLIKSNGQLQFEVDAFKVSNEKLKVRLQALNEDLEEVQSANFELNIRLAKAESESQMQQKLLRNSHQQDQILMDAFNNKLESLRQAIASRDDEIRRLRDDNQLALESMGIEYEPDDQDAGTDHERWARGEKLSSSHSGLANVIESSYDGGKKHALGRVANLIRERDAQIEELRNQLAQATFDQSTSAPKTIDKADRDDTETFEGQLDAQSNGENDTVTLAARCRMLEDELNEKDKQLLSITKRNRHLEKVLPEEIVDLVENLRAASAPVTLGAGHPGQDDLDGIEGKLAFVDRLSEDLSELLNRISSSRTLLDTVDQLQRVVLSRDRQIKGLVRELNELNAQINQDQISAPPDSPEGERSQSNVVGGPSESMGTQFDKDLASASEQESEGQPVVTNEDEDGDLANSEKPKVKARTTALIVVESKSQQSAQGETPLKGQKQEAGTRELIDSFLTIRDQIRFQFRTGGRRPGQSLFELRQRPGKRRTVRPKAKFTIDSRWREQTATKHEPTSTADNQRDEFNYLDRLRQLEGENQLLELAMKEILMSIKWSDARCSTILIDCPSLERLCQLIEARYIAGGGWRSEFDKTDGHGEALAAEPQRTLPANYRPPDEPSLKDEAKLESNLFQFVILKSELDLVRGQNEQLRSDLKLQRREWQLNRPREASEIEQKRSHVEEPQRKPEQASDRVRNLERLEAECQTDSLFVIDPRQLVLAPPEIAHAESADKNVEETSPSKGEKCRNCSRLVSLANHLLDCIVRIESRVNSSDESYISRLLTLYQLSQQLSQDLTLRDNLINHLRSENHRASQHSAIVESRLRSLEAHIEIHNKRCPLQMPTACLRQAPNNDLSKRPAPTNVQWYSATKNGSSQSIHSLTIRSNQKLVEVPLKDSRIAISLLQSIIACLQARLDYKDERLNQLEQLLVSS